MTWQYTSQQDFDDSNFPRGAGDPDGMTYYPGEQARVVIVNEPRDKHMWARQKCANDLGIPESELPEEPDEMSDHSDQQGWDLEGNYDQARR